MSMEVLALAAVILMGAGALVMWDLLAYCDEVEDEREDEQRGG